MIGPAGIVMGRVILPVTDASLQGQSDYAGRAGDHYDMAIHGV